MVISGSPVKRISIWKWRKWWLNTVQWTEERHIFPLVCQHCNTILRITEKDGVGTTISDIYSYIFKREWKMRKGAELIFVTNYICREKNCHVEKFWEILEKFWRNFGKFWEILENFRRFCHNLRTFTWRKIEPKKNICGEKWQIWGLEGVGGVELCLEFFLRFIPFGSATLPSVFFTGAVIM